MPQVRTRAEGPYQSLFLPVDSNQTIEIGDLLYLSTDDVRSALGFTWTTDLATTQENFHDLFIGMALQRHLSGEAAGIIQVLTEGIVVGFSCASAAFNVGALIGPAKQSGNGIEPQKLASVATVNLSIGRVAKQYSSATTELEIYLRSSLFGNGIQTPA